MELGKTSFVFPLPSPAGASEKETRPSVHPVTKTPGLYWLHCVQVDETDSSAVLRVWSWVVVFKVGMSGVAKSGMCEAAKVGVGDVAKLGMGGSSGSRVFTI